jgi:predicted lipid-binding transport protein (Tim44 family)
MKKHVVRVFTVVAAVLFLSITVLEFNAEARAGGSRSMGSRGSRSYARPASNYSQQSQQRQQIAPAPGPFQQQAGGGFMRGMAGGIMGGMLGSMLFSGVAGAGSGGMGGGGGIGLFEIVLLGGIGYLIYRYIKKKRAASSVSPYNR